MRAARSLEAAGDGPAVGSCLLAAVAAAAAAVVILVLRSLESVPRHSSQEVTASTNVGPALECCSYLWLLPADCHVRYSLQSITCNRIVKVVLHSHVYSNSSPCISARMGNAFHAGHLGYSAGHVKNLGTAVLGNPG